MIETVRNLVYKVVSTQRDQSVQEMPNFELNKIVKNCCYIIANVLVTQWAFSATFFITAVAFS